MEIFKIVSLGIVATTLIIILNNFKSEFSIYISILTSVIFFHDFNSFNFCNRCVEELIY